VFVIDTLVSCSSGRVRCAAKRFFVFAAGHSVKQAPRAGSGDDALAAMLRLLLQARLPFWMAGGGGRQRGRRGQLHGHALQYFQLLSQLLDLWRLTGRALVLWLDIPALHRHCLQWLLSVEPSPPSPSPAPSLQEGSGIRSGAEEGEDEEEREEEEDGLLTGHLGLMRALTAFPGIDKAGIRAPPSEGASDTGASLVQVLMDAFLFPASRSLARGETGAEPVALCSTDESRRAAFNLLVELCAGCAPNTVELAALLQTYHNKPGEMAGKWDHLPLLAARPAQGFVGLKNAGATCYMNSLLQQMSMQPCIRDALLAVSDDVEEEYLTKRAEGQAEAGAEAGDASSTSGGGTGGDVVVAAAVAPEPPPAHSMFYELQHIFGHLRDSRMQYIVPEGFWNT